jgi:hypothetical protein
MAGHRKRSRKMRGGAYSSASTYGEYVNGTTNAQFARTMDQSGPYGKIEGNLIIGAQGQNVSPASQVPTASQLALVQTAGKRRKGKGRSRRGGFLGEVINQAIVPFALLGMQQTYRRKRGGKKRTRKHRR